MSVKFFSYKAYLLTDIETPMPSGVVRLSDDDTMGDLLNKIARQNPGTKVNSIHFSPSGGSLLQRTPLSMKAFLRLQNGVPSGINWWDHIFHVTLNTAIPELPIPELPIPELPISELPIPITFHDLEGKLLGARSVMFLSGNVWGEKIVDEVSRLIPANYKIVCIGVRPGSDNPFLNIVTDPLSKFYIKSDTKIFVILNAQPPTSAGGKKAKRRKHKVV